MGSRVNRRVTMADVAKAAGVSTATVSLALSGKGTMTSGTRRRVRRHAARLGYVPNVRAQRLREGQSYSTAIITTAPASIVGGTSRLGFLLELALVAAETGLTRGYSLVLVPPLDDADSLTRLDIDGAIVVDPLRDDPYLAVLADRGVPVVTLGSGEAANVVGTVDRGAAGADVILPHLRARGGRRIAVLTTTEEHAVTRHVVAYADTWSATTGTPVVHDAASSQDGEQAGYDLARRLLLADPDVDCLYAPFDAFAVGAVRAIEELGRRVPADVMVATNYDGPRAQACSPQLTALDLGLDALGRSAMEVLLDHLDTGQSGRVVAAPHPVLVPRESTGRDVRPDLPTRDELPRIPLL